MTISTTEVVTPLDLGEGSTDLFPKVDTPSFPPLDDAIKAIKSFDWELMKQRSRRDIRQIGLVLAHTGEFIHNIGTRLSEV